MTRDPHDSIEKAIDEALAGMVSGEPRRVNAASVRRAFRVPSASRLPVWFAVAAMLLASLGIVLKSRGRFDPISSAPLAPEASREIRATPPPPSSVPAFAEALHSPLLPRASRTARSTNTEASYEGLPRLVTAAIDLPEPLATRGIESEALRIPSIEIAPLAISTLSNEHDQEHP